MQPILLFIMLCFICTIDARPMYYPKQRYRPSNNVVIARRNMRLRQPRFTRAQSVNVQEQQFPGENLDDFCRKCCAQGRSVSRECCLKCNSCQAYSDEGASECRDYPF